MWPPRVQVAGISSLEEALFCHSVGVDALGFTLELPTDVHDGLTNAKAARIIEKLPLKILPVVITYLSSATSARRLVQEVGARAIQFHGGISKEEIAGFRDLCPHVRTIGCVTVHDESAVETARQFGPPFWDAIILDSYDPGTGKHGATGKTHDWSISARIVTRARVPVILAGGLTPANVADAVRTVRPHGVDAHTGLEHPDGTRDFKKIREFTKNALKCLADIDNG